MGGGRFAKRTGRGGVAAVLVIATAGLLGGCTLDLWAERAPEPTAGDERPADPSPPEESTPVSLARAELERTVAAQLQQTVGQAPKGIDCPDPLTAKAGETTRCTLLTPDGTTFGVTVTVTRMQGPKAKLNIQVDQQPQ